jgi:hypothetical protein
MSPLVAKADIPITWANVRFRGQSGHGSDAFALVFSKIFQFRLSQQWQAGF